MNLPRKKKKAKKKSNKALLIEGVDGIKSGRRPLRKNRRKQNRRWGERRKKNEYEVS